VSNPSYLSDRRGLVGLNDTAPPVRVRPVQPGEVRAALRLILSNHGRIASEEQVVDFLRFAVHRRLNLNDIWVVESTHGFRGDASPFLWAILPVVSPGRTMLLFSPPHPEDPATRAAASELVPEVCRHWAARGVHLAQVLLDPADEPSQRLYEGCSFAMLAELIYLQASGRRTNDRPAETAGLHWRAYTPATHGLFAETIARSYEGSLDCPALNGQRAMEDIIAGHKAAGEFDPNLWGLLCDAHDRPTGVLLLARARQSDVLELVYLGLTPEHRGQGLADLMMSHALHAVRLRGCAFLSLAVDSRNLPALKLYYCHGMQRVCSKLALLRDLRVERVSQKPVEIS
jgi:ribosomal protein S18 acetylase RimI-like enzyme